jgi:hypothetical protein
VSRRSVGLTSLGPRCALSIFLSELAVRSRGALVGGQLRGDMLLVGAAAEIVIAGRLFHRVPGVPG